MAIERELNVGDIHDVLRNDRRREVLEMLQSNSGNATIRELSEHIAAIESEETPPPRNVRQSVYVSLHQTHLPKLDELGIIDYDTDAKSVKIRSEAKEVGEFMQDPTAKPAWWIQLCLVIGLTGLVGMGMAVLGILPSGVNPSMFALVLFAVISAIISYIWIKRIY